MMNMFVASQFTSDGLFHNESMYSNLLPINYNLFIFMRRFTCWLKSECTKLGEMCFSEATPRTIFGRVLAVARNIVRISTRVTSFYSTVSFHI